uniref:HAD family hydrolase n=1 Tax=Fervidicoccus fontis TaxID=683846 RepID=A0A7J3SKY0_9CREN
MKLVVILDYDMTIVDSFKVFYRVYNFLLKKFFSEEISIEKFKEMFCENTIDEYKKYPEDFWKEFKVLYKASQPDEISPMPGLDDFIKELEELGADIYIITGRGVGEEDVEKELELLNLNSLRGRVRTLKDSEGEHPFDKTEEVRRVLTEKLDHKCIMLGDYVDDILAAKKNGCIAIGITNGCKSPDYFTGSGADYVVNSLSEAKDLVRNIASH